MPNFAYVAENLYCPYCTGLVIDWLAFQWGFSPGYDVRAELEYRVGQPIRWRRCIDGAIKPWTYFRKGQYPHEVNIGDPSIADLIVQGRRTFDWNLPSERVRCPACSRPLEGAAVEIRNGVIARAWIYLPGELEHGVPGYVIDHDSTRREMYDWDTHPLVQVDDC